MIDAIILTFILFPIFLVCGFPHDDHCKAIAGYSSQSLITSLHRYGILVWSYSAAVCYRGLFEILIICF